MNKINYFISQMEQFDKSVDWIEKKIDECDNEKDLQYLIKQLHEEQDFILKLQEEFETFVANETQ